mgnify:CR=1 FL=1
MFFFGSFIFYHRTKMQAPPLLSMFVVRFDCSHSTHSHSSGSPFLGFYRFQSIRLDLLFTLHVCFFFAELLPLIIPLVWGGVCVCMYVLGDYSLGLVMCMQHNTQCSLSSLWILLPLRTHHSYMPTIIFFPYWLAKEKVEYVKPTFQSSLALLTKMIDLSESN